MSQSLANTNLDKIIERGVIEIFPDSDLEKEEKFRQENTRLFPPLTSFARQAHTSGNDLRKCLQSGKRIIKLGIDPTRPDLHLGHTVALRKLRQFQDAGHKAVLIIGDFTAQIGDPTGRSEARPRLTPEEVAYNAATYLEQAKKIIDFSSDRFELRRNGEWLNKLDLQQIITLQASMTVGQMLAKEGFSDRYEKGNPIYLHEFLYPLLQGYDSVAIDSDVELGGTDQKFNILVGRDLQLKDKNRQGKPAQFGMLLPLLVGLDGVQKMSKSVGNYVGLTDEPLSMYSKLEKVPDALVDQYFELLTDIDLASLPENPREKQKQLARVIVSQYHSPEIALQAQQDAEQIVIAGNTKDLGEIPEFNLAEINFPAPLHYLVKASGLCKSNSEAQSQIKNGAVKLDGEKLSDRTFANANELTGKVLQVGKKKFLRLVSE